MLKLNKYVLAAAIGLAFGISQAYKYLHGLVLDADGPTIPADSVDSWTYAPAREIEV